MIRIPSLIFYILFMHVYPVLHWHAHEHDGHVGIHASVHPPDLPMESHDHEGHSEKHAHEESHIDGDWEFVSQSQKLNIQFVENTLELFLEQFNMDSQVRNRLPREYPLKLPSNDARPTDPGRTPPYST